MRDRIAYRGRKMGSNLSATLSFIGKSHHIGSDVFRPMSHLPCNCTVAYCDITARWCRATKSRDSINRRCDIGLRRSTWVDESVVRSTRVAKWHRQFIYAKSSRNVSKMCRQSVRKTCMRKLSMYKLSLRMHKVKCAIPHEECRLGSPLPSLNRETV